MRKVQKHIALAPDEAKKAGKDRVDQFISMFSSLSEFSKKDDVSN